MNGTTGDIDGAI